VNCYVYYCNHPLTFLYLVDRHIITSTTLYTSLSAAKNLAFIVVYRCLPRKVLHCCRYAAREIVALSNTTLYLATDA